MDREVYAKVRLTGEQYLALLEAANKRGHSAPFRLIEDVLPKVVDDLVYEVVVGRKRVAWTPLQEKLLTAAQNAVNGVEKNRAGYYEMDDDTLAPLQDAVQEISNEAVETIRAVTEANRKTTREADGKDA